MPEQELRCFSLSQRDSAANTIANLLRKCNKFIIDDFAKTTGDAREIIVTITDLRGCHSLSIFISMFPY